MTLEEYRRKRTGGSVSPKTSAFVEWSRQKREQDEKRHTPLEWALNLLSIGNNITANTTENVMQSLQGKSIPFSEYVGDLFRSFTPEGEKSFRKVFWGDENEEGYKGMFGSGGVKGGSGSFGDKAFRWATGTLADIVLDPTNYVTFGATNAAKAAAGKAAELKMIARSANPIVDTKLFREGFDTRYLAKLKDAGKSKEAIEYAQKWAKDGTFAREYSRYYKEALRKSKDELKVDFLKSLDGKPYNPQGELVNSRIKGWADSYDNSLGKRVDELAAKGDYSRYKGIKGARTEKGLSTIVGNESETLRKALIDKTNAKRTFLRENSDSISRAASEAVRRKLRGEKDALSGITNPAIRDLFSGDKGLLSHLENSDLFSKVNLAEWENPLLGLDHAGESAFKLFRKELNTGTHEGFNNAAKQWDAFKASLGSKQIALGKKGTTYSDAWWSLMNNSVIGKTRRLLGFTNPYETMLKIKERDAAESMEYSIQKSVKGIQERLSEFSDEDKLEYVFLKSLKERIGQKEKYSGMDFKTFIRATAEKVKATTGQAIDVSDESLEALSRIDEEVSGVFKSLKESEDVWAALGYSNEIQELPDYLTFISQGGKPAPVGPGKKIGTQAQAFTKTKKKGLYRSISEQATALRDIVDMPDDQIAQLFQDNVTNTNLNLDEILASRAIQHYKLSKRVDMIESFKPFGMRVDEITVPSQHVDPFSLDHTKGEGFIAYTDESAESLKAARKEGRAMQGNMASDEYAGLMGLESVDDPYFDGYLFDEGVASIIDRTIKFSSNDPDIQALQNVFSGFTHLWKTTVTSNPGFHLRNFYSNMVTLFQQHGLDAIDGDTAKDAAIATLSSLNGVKKAAEQLGLSEAVVRQALGKTYGSHTLGELTEYARKKGIISMTFGGRDTKEAVVDLLGTGKKGALDTVGKVSRDVGSHIESFAKMDSFLIGAKKMVNKGGEITPTMLEYAKNESKKWFIDYEDLTAFEKDTMKKVFPFYTWLRRNISNQVGQIVAVENWPSMALPQKLIRSFKDTSIDMAKMPGYMREEGAVPVGRDDDDNIIFMYPQLPMNDLNKLPFRSGSTLKETLGNSFDAFMNTMIDSAHPFLKAGLSLYDYVNKDDRDRRKKETSGTAEDMALAVTDSVLRLFGETATERGENGRLMVDSDVLETIRALAPQIRTIDRLLSGPISATKVLSLDTEVLISEVAARDTKADKTRALWNALSFYAGIRGTSVDENEERYRRAQGIYYGALDEKSKAEKKSSGYTSRSLKNRKQMEKTYRRLRIL
ncbi:hypothetical protein SDC9_05169 [bioreactor metagenome]|uniref:Large polyvalent protein associated domain-containing protein n=1 Tax=bioreactor metagenome TaxID=1076179 RepID=A0A644SYC7_9ZZZZ